MSSLPGPQPPLPGQMSFGFPDLRRRFDDLAVTASNARVMRAARQPEHWAMPVLCVTGGAKSGLTTLARAWSELFDLPFRAASQGLMRADADALSLTGGAIDNADTLENEEALLSLINQISASSQRLLLTSHAPPVRWPVHSADLRSRLNAMALAVIDAPDEAMMKLRLRAAGERYFLRMDEDTLNFLVPRLELSYDAAETVVAAISTSVSETGRGPTIPLVRETLLTLAKWGVLPQTPDAASTD